MNDITTYDKLEEFGRVRLSPSFFMRDFLYSEIAAWHQMRNVPDHPDAAISVGKELCNQLLEPLQSIFGRIHVRSGYRSPSVNELGNKGGHNCASNASNYAAHIWDYPDAQGQRGATACIVVPWLVDHVARGGHWSDMAWWIHDHLPYSSLYFFPKLCAFNINWHQSPVRRIDSYAQPKGCLTRAGMANHEGLHAQHYAGFPEPDRSSIGLSMPQGMSAEVSPVSSPTPQLSSTSAVASKRQEPIIATAIKETPVNACAINYRAVHSKTKWRKARGHGSLESAIHGRDGAAGLFARKVRIDYEKHGDPLYVLVWADGAANGYVIRPDKAALNGIRQIQVSIDVLMSCEQAGQADHSVLDRLF